jgi:hypothetical protein
MTLGTLHEMLVHSRLKEYVTITVLGIIHRPVFYLKQRFGDWILYPSSDGTTLAGPKRELISVSGHKQQPQKGL